MIDLRYPIGDYAYIEARDIPTVAQAWDEYEQIKHYFGDIPNGQPVLNTPNCHQQEDVTTTEKKARGAVKGQIMQAGSQCLWDDCRKGLKLSKAGNAYCPCWYK